MAVSDFKLTRPCDNCPFRIEGGIRLRASRAREIARSQTDSQGSTFSCHKTVEHGEDDEPMRGRDEQYCAGAIAYALNVGRANQFLRIAGRLGWIVDIKDRDKVFTSETAMLKAQER